MAETIELKSVGCPVKFEFYRKMKNILAWKKREGTQIFMMVMIGSDFKVILPDDLRKFLK